MASIAKNNCLASEWEETIVYSHLLETGNSQLFHKINDDDDDDESLDGKTAALVLLLQTWIRFSEKN